MAPYRRHFSIVKFGEILSAGGLTMRDLPTIERYMRGASCNICYNYLCEKCTIQACHFIHVPGDELYAQFVEKFCHMAVAGTQDADSTTVDEMGVTAIGTGATAMVGAGVAVAAPDSQPPPFPSRGSGGASRVQMSK